MTADTAAGGRPPLVVALDYPEAGPALETAESLLGRAVAGAVAAAARAGASLVTVHCSGGRAMLEAAAEAAAEGLGLLGVTVLTSLDQADLAATGVAGHVIDQVLRLAALAAGAGLAGVVASPREAAQLRAVHRPPFLIVTPGVRPVWAPGAGDQNRLATPRRAILSGADLTPRRAILSGADLVVVGRPVTRSGDPAAAAERLGLELVEALREKGRPRPFGEELE